MTLGEIVRQLPRFDEEPMSWQEPSIYAKEPRLASSEAVVEWSLPKGGLPAQAAVRLLYYFVSVRKALEVLGVDYERLLKADKIDELCALLVSRVEQSQISSAK